MTVRQAARSIARFLGLAVIALALGGLATPAHAQSAAGYSEFYIPGATQQMWDIFENLDNNPDLVEASGMHNVTAVTATLDSTTIYYDHWEDGYDFDPANPAATADESYVLNSGDVQEFESSNIPVDPRGTATFYDGRDRIFVAGGPVTVTGAHWPESIGTVFSLAWEIYPTKPFLTNYTIPVGQDLAGAPNNYIDFTRAYVIVQSTTDNNTVVVDDPSTGPVDLTVTLNRGEVTQLYSINSGTTVAADDPVQVQFIVGRFATGNTSEIDGYSAVPDSLWDNEYYNPVGSAAVGGGDVDLFLYNPNSSAITINFEDLTGSGSFSVPANSTRSYSAGAGRLVPNNSGVYLSSSSIFWGIGSGDTESANWDWGYSLVPVNALQDHYFLGWAPGSSEATPTVNGSPAYITPVQDDTTVFVDYSPTDGTVDATFTLNRLQTQRVFDPDDENTGMHIFATGDIAVAWGEDPNVAATGTPYLDLGYSTLPFPPEWMDLVLGIEKTANPTSLPQSAGQTSTFTLVVSTFTFPVDDVDVFDTLPPGWVYVAGSTTITLPDNSTITPDPTTIVGQVLTWDLNQGMPISETLTVEFDAQTTAGVSGGLNQNDGEASGTRLGGAQVFAPIDSAFVFLSPTGLSIDKDTSTPTVDPGTTASYSIVLANGGTNPVTNLTIGDDLPTGFTFASAVISETNATRTATSNPSVGANNLAWGTWTINPGGNVTIGFVVNVATGTPLGTYDNTATADSTQSGPIDDAGTAGGDPDTPAGQDPETDEDVTLADALPTLTVTKTPGVATIPEPGGSVTFTVQVQNTSPESVTLLTLTDTDFGNLNGQGTCATGGTIAAGATYTCSFSGAVSGNAGDTHSNTATATIRDDELNSASAFDDASVAITDVLPTLVVTKSAGVASIPEPGGSVTFTVQVQNTSVESVTLLTLTDTDFGDLNGQGTCATGGTIAAGATYTCSFSGAVSGNAGDTHSNTTSATISDDEANSVSDTDDASVAITNVSSSISVTKSADPTGIPEPGASVTFSVQITNTSAADSVTITSLSDDVHGNLDGQGSCVVPQIIAVGGSYSCSFTATVSGSAGVSETDTVTALGTDDDSSPVSGSDDATVFLVGLTKTLVATNQTFTAGTNVAIGEILTYQVALQVAPGTSTGMTLEDVLDLGLAFDECLSITPSSGALTTTVSGGFAAVCDSAPPSPAASAEPSGSLLLENQGRRANFDFGDVGNPTGGVETLTVLYTVVVLDNADNDRGDTLANEATWSWDAGSGTDSAESVIIVEPTLSLSKAATPTIGLPGTVITFTLDIQHTGVSNTDAFDLVLTDTLPAGLTYVPGSLDWTGVGLPPDSLDDSAAPALEAIWDDFPLCCFSQITYQAILGSLPAGTSLSNAAFLEWSSLPGDVSVAQSAFNTLSTERDYDPSNAVDVYRVGTSTSVAVAAAAGLPATGFAPGRLTALPSDPFSYHGLGGIWLEIPALGKSVSVVGVPLTEAGWDLTWLSSQAGYLEGTAFPGWQGNSALTAHAYTPDGLPGPFAGLANLQWGDQIILYAFGQEYIYEVRQVRSVRPNDLSVLRHEELAWLTLLTCSSYDEASESYLRRVAVRAVLIEVR
ncbi:MAG: sortase [Anaerolineales bacterium]